MLLIIIGAVTSGTMIGFVSGWIIGFAKGQHNVLTIGKHNGKRHL